MWAESKELIADARRIESQVVEHVLDTADVLCTTLTGIDSELLGKRHFDLAVIAEWSAAALAGAGSDRGTPTRLTGAGREPSASARFTPKSELQPQPANPQAMISQPLLPLSPVTVDG